MLHSAIQFAPHAADAMMPSGPERTALALALREARAAGRPYLTAAKLNRAIPAADDPRHAEVLGEAALDPHAFLARRFTLTQSQLDALACIADADMVRLQALLHRAAGAGADVRLDIYESDDGEEVAISALSVRPDGRMEEVLLEPAPASPELAM